jgi:hypothetical protein
MKYDKAVSLVSRAFTEMVVGKQEGAVLLYGPTERHSVTEWAAKIGYDNGWARYVSIAIWEIASEPLIGVRTSAGLADPKDEKLVADFSHQVPVGLDYDAFIEIVEDLLQQALMAANQRRLLELEQLGGAHRVGKPYDFAFPGS